MSGVITTGNHPKALWPGIHAWFGRAYNEHPLEYKGCFNTEKSGKAYEEDVEATGFGLAPIKTQGGAISYDSETQGPTTRYTHVTVGLGYIVTQEELDDNLYEVVSKRRAKALAFSMRQTKETIAANIFNRATTSGYVGGDGVTLLSTAHPTVDGTQSNTLGTAADLSEASLEDMLIQIMNAKNSRGLKISLLGKKLIVPTAEAFNAERILKTQLRSGTDLNDINAIKNMGLLPEGFMVNHYFTDSDSWFIRTNAPNGLTHFERKKLKFGKDKDFDTDNAKSKATERFSFGWTDWRGVYGTMGAA